MGKLLDKLTEYGNSDFYPYHMPGHKRQPMAGFPQQITDVDITEIAGFDNLHDAEGILAQAQTRTAQAYGAEESFYLINGSTCGILSAVSATVPFGGHLLIARNCHKSVYHAAYLRHLKLSYIYPAVLTEYDVCEAVTAQKVEDALQREPSIQAVLIVSPTYEGRIADVKSIAEVVHARGIPLIVDEAHGAHFGFAEGFAQNSSRLGADLVINSTHKTLSAMTQTALLHCNGGMIDREMLKRFLRIYQSSSPSYVMMASIDHAVEMAVRGNVTFAQFRENWEKMLQELRDLVHLKILPGSDGGHDKKLHDIGKLVISTKGTNVSGKQLMDILREKYHLEPEMACETYVLVMFTVADSREGYDRLTRALLEIDEVWKDGGMPGNDESFRCDIASEADGMLDGHILPFYQAWDCKKLQVSLEKAEGARAGEFIYLYPPGTPMVVPGEVLNHEMIRRIQHCLESGLEVCGVNADINQGYTVIILSEENS